MRNLAEAIAVAKGKKEPDLLLKNTSFVNVFTGEIDHGDMVIYQGYIVGIGEYSGDNGINLAGKFILPGFIDSHIHLESSLVMPEEFAKAVLAHGTTTVVTDPHEIANVMGTKGIDLMLQATEGLPLDVGLMLPSCVPCTPLDESGAVLSHLELAPYYNHPRVLGLAEVMDYSGILASNPDLLAKLQNATQANSVIDGHAPFLTGRSLQAYLTAGICSDHECVHLAEAKEKLRFGQHIMIREGTAAHNLQSLAPLLTPKTGHRCMFCSDDKHPNHLLEEGHMDTILRKVVAMGIDPCIAVQAATYNPAQYFGMKHKGALAPHYLADMVVVDNLRDFHVDSVYKEGKLIYHAKTQSTISFPSPKIHSELLEKAENSLNLPSTTPESFKLDKPSGILGIVPGEILTTHCGTTDTPHPDNDVLKLAVLERHHNTGNIGVGFLKGYGLKQGAIATSIAHDSHNIIAVGISDQEISTAVNALLALQGGIVVVQDGEVLASLPLSIGGIMSRDSLVSVNAALENAKKIAYAKGVCPEIDPFMTLSFLSLPVIPTLRLTTKGVFDVIAEEYM